MSNIADVLPNPTDQNNKVETPFLSLWFDGDFLCCQYASDLHMTLDIARSCVESRIFFAKGNSYPLLVDMRGIRSSTKEARTYLASIGSTLVKAGALITGSAVNKALGNLFLTLDKPMVPTRLFTSEQNARQWLMRYI